MSEIIVLIPSKNESTTLFKILRNIKFKTVIINDGSTDGTEKKLRSLNIDFITNQKTLGYETSLLKGFKYIKKNYKKCRYILTMDADGEHPPKYINKIINVANVKNADLVMGYRSKYNRISEYIISFFFNKKFGISDPLTGFKIYKAKELYKFLNKVKSSYFLIDLLLLFKLANLKICKINIQTKKRRSTSRVGSIIYSNIKIFLFIKFVFF